MELKEKISGLQFTTLHDKTDEQIGTVAHTCSYEDLETAWDDHLYLMDETNSNPCITVFQNHCKAIGMDIEYVSIHLY